MLCHTNLHEADLSVLKSSCPCRTQDRDIEIEDACVIVYVISELAKYDVKA